MMATPAFRLDPNSVKRVLGNTRREMDAISKKAASELFVEAEEILTRSRAEFVPVDQGILRADSGVTQPEQDGDSLKLTIWYGAGPARDYAVVQHEQMDFKHGVGGPKYLERPLLEAISGMGQRIASRVK